MGWPQWIVLIVALQRVAELIVARRNTVRLLRRGGREHGRAHYPLFVLLHAGWLLAIFLAAAPQKLPNLPLLAAFIALQAGRIWVVATLGAYWTTRIITIDDAPLVRRGPYRWVAHPNYLIVALEIVVLPLVFGAWELALIFGSLNLALLGWRIRVEAEALAPRRRESGR